MTSRFSWLAFLRAAGRGLLALPISLLAPLPFVWMAGIWLLSSRSFGEPGEQRGFRAFLGNLGHAPVYGLLALLWTALLLRPRPGEWPRLPARTALLVLVLVGGYGLVDEWHQSGTVGRQSSLSDAVTDFVAAGCVLWIVAYLGRRGAHEGGLRLRLLAGIVLSCLAAWGALLY